MSLIIRILVCSVVFLASTPFTSAGFFDDFITNGSPDVRYCDTEGECWIQEGIDLIEWNLDNIVTDQKASEYIQNIIIYLLGLISIVGVIYIMYAGFMILIGNGDEEKLKSSRQTIIYVLIWIVVIWLAYPIMKFIINVLNS